MIRAGDVIALGARRVRVSCMPDGRSLCLDARGRIAVRNILTHRLSYLPASRLLRGQTADTAAHLDAALACLRDVERWHEEMLEKVRGVLADMEGQS